MAFSVREDGTEKKQPFDVGGRLTPGQLERLFDDSRLDGTVKETRTRAGVKNFDFLTAYELGLTHPLGDGHGKGVLIPVQGSNNKADARALYLRMQTARALLRNVKRGQDVFHPSNVLDLNYATELVAHQGASRLVLELDMGERTLAWDGWGVTARGVLPPPVDVDAASSIARVSDAVSLVRSFVWRVLRSRMRGRNREAYISSIGVLGEWTSLEEAARISAAAPPVNGQAFPLGDLRHAHRVQRLFLVFPSMEFKDGASMNEFGSEVGQNWARWWEEHSSRDGDSDDDGDLFGDDDGDDDLLATQPAQAFDGEPQAYENEELPRFEQVARASSLTVPVGAPWPCAKGVNGRVYVPIGLLSSAPRSRNTAAERVFVGAGGAVDEALNEDAAGRLEDAHWMSMFYMTPSFSGALGADLPVKRLALLPRDLGSVADDPDVDAGNDLLNYLLVQKVLEQSETGSGPFYTFDGDSHIHQEPSDDVSWAPRRLNAQDLYQMVQSVQLDVGTETFTEKQFVHLVMAAVSLSYAPVGGGNWLRSRRLPTPLASSRTDSPWSASVMTQVTNGCFRDELKEVKEFDLLKDLQGVAIPGAKKGAVDGAKAVTAAVRHGCTIGRGKSFYQVFTVSKNGMNSAVELQRSSRAINSFSGFMKLESQDLRTVEARDSADYIADWIERQICCASHEDYLELCRYVVYLLCRPEVRNQDLLCLFGNPGAGKTIFLSALAALMGGYAKSLSMEQAIGRFGAPDTVLVILDEVNVCNSPSSTAEQKAMMLKSFGTVTERTYEAKGKDMVEGHCVERYIASANTVGQLGPLAADRRTKPIGRPKGHPLAAPAIDDEGAKEVVKHIRAKDHLGLRRWVWNLLQDPDIASVVGEDSWSMPPTSASLDLSLGYGPHGSVLWFWKETAETGILGGAGRKEAHDALVAFMRTMTDWPTGTALWGIKVMDHSLYNAYTAWAEITGVAKVAKRLAFMQSTLTILNGPCKITSAELKLPVPAGRVDFNLPTPVVTGENANFIDSSADVQKKAKKTTVDPQQTTLGESAQQASQDLDDLCKSRTEVTDSYIKWFGRPPGETRIRLPTFRFACTVRDLQIAVHGAMVRFRMDELFPGTTPDSGGVLKEPVEAPSGAPSQPSPPVPPLRRDDQTWDECVALLFEGPATGGAAQPPSDEQVFLRLESPCPTVREDASEYQVRQLVTLRTAAMDLDVRAIAQREERSDRQREEWVNHLLEQVVHRPVVSEDRDRRHRETNDKMTDAFRALSTGPATENSTEECDLVFSSIVATDPFDFAEKVKNLPMVRYQFQHLVRGGYSAPAALAQLHDAYKKARQGGTKRTLHHEEDQEFSQAPDASQQDDEWLFAVPPPPEKRRRGE